MALLLAPRNPGFYISQQLLADWNHVIQREYGIDHGAKFNNGTPPIPRVRDINGKIDINCVCCDVRLPKMTEDARPMPFLREAHITNGAVYCSIACYARARGPRTSRTEIPDNYLVILCECHDGVTRVRTIYQPICDCGSTARGEVENYTRRTRGGDAHVAAHHEHPLPDHRVEPG